MVCLKVLCAPKPSQPRLALDPHKPISSSRSSILDRRIAAIAAATWIVEASDVLRVHSLLHPTSLDPKPHALMLQPEANREHSGVASIRG